MKRIGLLLPSSNTVMEPDLYRSLPAGKATLHTARMYLSETTAAAERAMVGEYLERAVADLATVEPDLVVFGCTSAGALLGADGERALVARIEAATGAAVLTVVDAVQAALRARRWRSWSRPRGWRAAARTMGSMGCSSRAPTSRGSRLRRCSPTPWGVCPASQAMGA
jgi:maleate cis-trans isomerase